MPLPRQEGSRISPKRKRYMCYVSRRPGIVSGSPSTIRRSLKAVNRSRKSNCNPGTPWLFRKGVESDLLFAIMRRRFLISCLLVLAVTTVSAQLTPHPAGEMSSMNFKTEPEAINLLTTSVIFTTVDDDNLLLNNAHKINDIRYEIRPGIAFALSRPQLRWNLAFGPALTLHQQVAQRDLFTETFGTDFKYDITAHLTARLRDNYVIRSDPFYDALNNGS